MDEHEVRTGSFDQPAAPVSRPTRSSRVPSALAAAAVVGVLAVAVGASALTAAAPAPARPAQVAPDASASADPSGKPERPKRDAAERGEKLGRFGRIEVTSVDGNRIGLKTEDGWTRTITITADTEITRGGEAATAADLQVGDTIVLRQRRNDDGTFTVTRIAVPSPRLGGVVTKVEGNTVTVTARRGESLTLTVDGATKYFLGRDAGTKADLKVGSRIAARGALGGGPGFRATEIRIAPPLITGRVTSVTGTTITVEQRDGTKITIHVAADTQFRVRGKGADAKIADVVVGAKIAATGSLRADGSMDATVVLAGKVRPARPAASPSAATG
jgi:hypothetical protein